MVFFAGVVQDGAFEYVEQVEVNFLVVHQYLQYL